jgi:histidine ammonia-lyase
VTDPVLVGPGGISPADVVRTARELALVELLPEVEATVLAGRAVVDRLVAGDRLIYGLNTGLGHMRDHRVPLEVLQRYQRQMIEAHASGIGPPLDTEDVRAAMLARVSGAARGGSGLTLEAVRLLVAMLNAGVHPIVPSAGSVGAGDLMHMAAIASVMIGKGEAELNGEPLPAAEALARAGLAPIDAQPKEGLALVASNGVAIGAGALVAEEAQRLARLADLACALSLEAVSGNPGPFDEAAGAAKAIPGQLAARPRCVRCSRAPTSTIPPRCCRCRIPSRSGSRHRSTAPTGSR